MLIIPHGYLVGSRKKLTSDVSVSDLENADNMTLISDSFEGITTLLESLDSICHNIKLLAVLPDDDAQPPSPMTWKQPCFLSHRYTTYRVS